MLCCVQETKSPLPCPFQPDMPRFSAKQKCFFLKKTFLTALESRLFYKPKAFLAHKPCLAVLKRQAFPSSISHSHPAITYCPPKNTAILFISALNPYAVTPERRTDSKPFRRRFVRKTGFGSCRRKYLQKYFRQSFESRSQDGVPRAFWLLFARRKK